VKNLEWTVKNPEWTMKNSEWNRVISRNARTAPPEPTGSMHGTARSRQSQEREHILTVVPKLGEFFREIQGIPQDSSLVRSGK